METRRYNGYTTRPVTEGVFKIVRANGHILLHSHLPILVSIRNSFFSAQSTGRRLPNNLLAVKATSNDEPDTSCTDLRFGRYPSQGAREHLGSYAQTIKIMGPTYLTIPD